MPDLKSSVLFVGSLPGEFQNLAQRLGGELASDLAESRVAQSKNKAEVIVVAGEALSKVDPQEALYELLGASPAAQLILLGPELGAKDLVTLTNRSRIFKVIKSNDLAQVELAVRQAFEEFALLEQHRQLVELFNQQNDSLTSMSEQLEDRVRKRQTFLESAKAKLLSANRQLELLESALIVVYQASSLPQIESELLRVLGGPLGVRKVSIQSSSGSHSGAAKNSDDQTHRFPLETPNSVSSSGHLAISLGNGHKLSERDHDLLTQITASVSLAVERLRRFQEAETLKLQWQATFDAISAPVALIDRNYTVRRANTAFAEAAGLSSEAVGGRKCYEALFSRTTPCDPCLMGTTFTLPPFDRKNSPTRIFNVTSHKIAEPVGQPEVDSGAVYVNTYRDIGERHRLERQILESAKMAELGTIGGSIAHELNNPLSGIITFLQLMKMDLKGDESFYEDILEMESGALRCKEIIQNLLGFSRKHDLGQPDDIELISVIRRAIGIVDLQARSIGVEFEIQTGGQNLTVKGYANPLTQAFVNLLQAWLDQVLGFIKASPISRPRCVITFKQEGARFHVDMQLQMVRAPQSDQTAPTKLPLPRQDIQLGLKVATQIFVEHGGVLEKFTEHSALNTSTTASPIPFARLVF